MQQRRNITVIEDKNVELNNTITGDTINRNIFFPKLRKRSAYFVSPSKESRASAKGRNHDTRRRENLRPSQRLGR